MSGPEEYKWPTFPTPFKSTDYGEGVEPMALGELNMIKMSATIRRKPFWFDKIKQCAITKKWEEEARAEGMSDNQISYVFGELHYYASLRNSTTGIEVSDVDGVWHSDSLINETLRNKLLEGVKILEEIPVALRDWHPGSKKQVWNLVHPSLYPIMYGKTRIVPVAKPALNYCGSGVIIHEFDTDQCKKVTVVADDDDQEDGDSENDEDLATEIVTAPPVEINDESLNEETEQVLSSSEEDDESGQSSEDSSSDESTGDDESETKNQRNWNSDYTTSTKFSWLPTDFVVNNDGTVKITSYINNLHPVHHKSLYRTLEKIFSKFVPLFEKVLQDQIQVRTNRIPVTRDWYSYDRSPHSSDDDHSQNHRNSILLPEPNFEFEPPPPVTNKISLRGKTLQVIVKLANIVLTPNKPKYKGGVWHVEGMENERIVASGIYYYDVENISKSELAFRQGIQEPDYEQGDERGVREVYGLEDEEPLNQILGSSLTPQNRCLAFPNIYQHQVQPFQLIDRTKPGHRKILVFFLVDPGKPILSTTTVPPQQMAWYKEELLKIPPFCDLPLEIVEHILTFVDWPLSLKKAKKIRRSLMKERKYFISQNNEKFFERPFSLCEH